jgi:hypothetical protein
MKYSTKQFGSASLDDGLPATRKPSEARRVIMPPMANIIQP